MPQNSDHFPSGPSKITSVTDSKELERGAMRLRSESDTYHTLSDVTLFSSSLPVLPHETLNLIPTKDGFQSIDDLSSALNKPQTGTEVRDLIEDVESHAIGSLLPDDEDELLAGIMDGFGITGLLNRTDDSEEYDFFGGGGGLELDVDQFGSLSLGITQVSLSDSFVGNGVAPYSLPNGMGALAGEHPHGEHPSRTLFVRNINSNVEDSELRTMFEQYGAIRTLYTACKHRGFVMISYYDIRDARNAMRALQNKPLRRRKLDIHFSIPKDNPSDKDINQGTLVVFNLDTSVSNDDLLQIFGEHGEVKEIRETPHKRHHKFVEYYDVRSAEAALRSLNRSDIAGKRIKVEPSRPGGARRNSLLQTNQDFEQDDSRSFRLQVSSSLANSPPSKWLQYGIPVDVQTISKSPVLGSMIPNNIPGLASILQPQLPNPGKIAPIGKDHGRRSHVEHTSSNGNLIHGVSFEQSHSLPEQKLSQFSGINSTSNGSGVETLSGPQFLWGSPKLQTDYTNMAAWQTPTIRQPFTSNGQYHGFAYTGRHGSTIGSPHPHNHNHHVGSAPSGVHFEQQFGHYQQSLDTLFRSPPTFGPMGLGHNDRSFMDPRMGLHGSVNTCLPENGSLTPSFSMMASPRLSPTLLGNGHYPGLASVNMEGLTDRGRNRRVESTASHVDNKKQFQLDLDKIFNGEDNRTTLMIKNIPNKYTSKMLLDAIDENHRGTYDFLYLPIDFKNKCNVGYAFINMLSPSHIIPFYQAFNGKKWEKFNSEKVAALAYARIQGKSALVTHFQNSSLMNEDKCCRPLLFHSEGSEAGDQVIEEPLPSNGLNMLTSQSNKPVSDLGKFSGIYRKDSEVQVQSSLEDC